MKETGLPRFRELDRAECEAVLARNQVGRIAYSFRDRVDIEPLHYAYADGWIYARTAPGAKLMTLAHNRWAAFQVDEVVGLFEWRSVVVHGAVYPVRSAEAGGDPALFDRALAALRGVIPDSLTDADPVPFRTELFRIHADEVTGREATPA